MRHDSTGPYFWMLCGSFCSAWMVVFTHLIGDACDWQVVAFMRAFLALVFAAILTVAAGAPLLSWRPGILWLRSFAGSGSMVCTFYALTHMDPTIVVTLTNTFPIWIALLSWPLEQEAPTPSVWLSIGFGIVGVVLIQQPELDKGNYAAFSALAAAVFSALAMMGLNRLQELDTRSIVVHFSAVASVVCLVAYFVFEHRPVTPFVIDTPTALLFLGIGVSATIAQIFLTKAFASSNRPANVSVVNLSQIVFVMVTEWLLAQCFPTSRLLKRELNWISMLGTLLIVAPTAWLMVRRRPRLLRRDDRMTG